MRPLVRACLAALPLVLAAPPALAGPAGFAFLEIPAGARASALGGAFTTLGRGVEAAFWNPAGLEPVQSVEVLGGHYEMFDRLRHDHFAVAGRLLGLGVAGSVRALYSEPIEERDELGNLIGSFGSHDLEFALGLGGRVRPGLSAGISAQLVRERIANSAATTYAFGAGAAWEPDRWPGARAALAVSGLGPAARFSIEGARGEPVPLPAAVQGGVSYRLGVASTLSLATALEARVTRGRTAVGLAGAELGHAGGAALRLGLRVNDDASAFSAGAGYALGALRLDYAWVPLRDDLGDSHRFAFAARF